MIRNGKGSEVGTRARKGWVKGGRGEKVVKWEREGERAEKGANLNRSCQYQIETMMEFQQLNKANH
jgi:hypothetical protein